MARKCGYRWAASARRMPFAPPRSHSVACRGEVDPIEKRQEVAHLDALHGAQELLEPCLIGVQGTEEVATVFRLVLREARPQRLRQVAPEAVQP